MDGNQAIVCILEFTLCFHQNLFPFRCEAHRSPALHLSEQRSRTEVTSRSRCLFVLRSVRINFIVSLCEGFFLFSWRVKQRAGAQRERDEVLLKCFFSFLVRLRAFHTCAKTAIVEEDLRIISVFILFIFLKWYVTVKVRGGKRVIRNDSGCSSGLNLSSRLFTRSQCSHPVWNYSVPRVRVCVGAAVVACGPALCSAWFPQWGVDVVGADTFIWTWGGVSQLPEAAGSGNKLPAKYIFSSGLAFFFIFFFCRRL